MNDVMVYRLLAEMDKQWGTVEEGQPRLPSADVPPVNEMMVCQIRATLRELWPDEFDTKPKLTLIQGGKGRAS